MTPAQRGGFGLRTFQRKQDMTYTQQQQYYDNLRPKAQEGFEKPPEQRAQEQLGYVPTWGQDPREVARAHQIIKATPQGTPLPDWIEQQKDAIQEAYNWHSFRNNGKPDTEWKYLPAEDPGIQFLSGLYGPPEKKPPVFTNQQAVQQGAAQWADIDPNERKQMLADPSFDIAQYPVQMRDQILNDPNFDWSKVPKWQKKYWEVMSNPKIMASPMALAGAHAGGMFGIPGRLVGAGLGYGLGLVGGQQYDPTAGVFDQPTTVAGAMAVLNKLSEGAEMTAGYTAQLSDAAIAGAQGNEQASEAARKMLFDPNYRKATWEAGRVAYEVSDFMGARNWIPGLAKLLGDEQAVFAGGGEDFIIGQASPVDRAKARGFNPVTGNFYDVTDSQGILQEARLTIHDALVKGASEEEVRDIIRGMLGEQGQYVGAQVADFAGQMVIDPLEHLPGITNKASGKLASLLGNETAVRAFSETNAPFEAARRYKTLVQSGDVAPGFDYAKMGSFERMVAGLNEKGQIKAGPFTDAGLLDSPTQQKGMIAKFKNDIAALTPEARAREGASMFYNNVSTLLSTFSDPAEIGNFFRKIAGSDMKQWAEMGSRVTNSPEWYTILPAMKAFDTKKLDGLMGAWDLAAPKRDALMKIADVLGEEPGKFVEDLAKRGTAEQDFQRVAQRLQQSTSPQAKQLLDSIQRGEFTPDSLKDIVDAFTGEGALYWHPDQFKAATLDALGAHFDEWTVEKLGLGDDPAAKSAFFRTSHLLKSAQSVVLLGFSPGYALQNGLSGMVHRAATGVWGYMTPNQIDTWLTRFGVEPARLQEGVGIGGIVENATTKGSVHTEAITKAVRGKGNDFLSKAQKMVSGIGKGMPFNKLSSWFESVEGKNAYMIAMKDMWSKTWKRGAGFKEMTPQLRSQMEAAGVNPNTLYALIESGMNKAEIESHILNKNSGVLARSLVHDAAQKAGMTSSQASTLLEKVGVLDELDRDLTNANTPDKVRNAFRQAIAKAADYNDMQTGRDLKAIAEDVKNKTQAEGVVAALDVVQKVNGNYFDAWLDHYARFGEMFEDLREIPDLATRNKAIEMNYQVSDGEFRRINARTAANYQGIFEAWGRSQNPAAMQILASIAQQDASMKYAYDYMRKIRREYFDTYSGTEPGDLAAQAAWYEGQSKIDTEFQIAFDKKASAEKAQGEAMGNLYEEMYGPAAGEAARKWWEDYTKFSADIVKRERKFRASLAGMDKDAREAAKAKYYSTDKVAQIAELEKINQEGIQRLERVVKKGRPPEGGIPVDPTQPPKGPTPFDDVNQLMAEAEQRKAQETQQAAEQLKNVWDIAEEFARESLPYDRTVLQDKFALLGALKKEQYGGFNDLTGLNDPRLTPDKVREIMDRRAEAKATEQNVKVEQAMTFAQDAASNARIPKINDNTNILKAISEHGGLSYELALDLTGEQRPKTAPGVFRRKGTGIDDMARMLAEDGYPIDVNAPDDPGGIRQTTELLNRARSGDEIFPMGHDHEAMIIRAENQAAERAMMEALAEPEFDPATWQAGLEAAIQRGDLTDMYERMGELPEEMGNTPSPHPSPDGRGGSETWNDYMNRISDETVARVEQEARDISIAEGMVRAETDMADAEAHGDAVMTRRMFEEQIKEAFDLTDEQANAYMELSESLSGWYQRTTGESGDAMYSRYYEDVVKGGEGELFQDQLQPVNRRMSGTEVESYARALVRSGADELRRAVVNETVKADRIAILDAAHKLDPQLAESVARGVSDALFQETFGQATPVTAKGAVTFDADGLKAPIHAFESKDFTTLVHENAHVFRRMLADVATRTDNPKIKADLQVIEKWAGVKDGQWTRASEEQFARGFERYITEGKAPNARLRRAFESFKTWMLQVYQKINGSAIDVKISDDVRAVFDRMVGDETARQADIQQLLTSGGDMRVPAYESLRKTWDTLDADSQNEALGWILQKTMVDPLSGIETLVAKNISGEKPAGWVEGVSDLNALTAINNTWGHGAGDALIAGIGRIARSEVTKYGGRAFRVGGDEFSYWFPDADTARQAMDSIDRRVFKEVFNVGGEDRTGFTVSFGIGETLELADTSLYTDKLRRIETGQRPKVRDQMPETVVRVADKLNDIRSENFQTLDEYRNKVTVEKNGKEQFVVVQEGADRTFRTTVEGATSADIAIRRVYDRQKAQFNKMLSEPDTGFFDELQDYQKDLKEAYTTSPSFVAWKDAKPGDMVADGKQLVKRNIAKKADAQTLATEAVGIVMLDGKKWAVVKDVPTPTTTPRDPNILFQSADKPFGTMDNASGFKADSEWMDDGYRQHVRPLLDAMQETAIDRMTNERPLDGAFKDMSPEGQKMLRQYMNQVQNDMGSVKLSTMKWGESQRDFAMLNYNRRYGFDRYMEAGIPYEFFYTRSMMTWGMRALDKPSWFADYARIRNMQNKHERDIPERLRNKFKIDAPWLPKWMGDALYIDPLQTLFTPANFLRPVETMMRDKNYQVIETERILQEWAADGQSTQDEILRAAQTQEGSLWERAQAEASIRRESQIASPFDFFATMFGPAWYLSTPLNLMGVEVPFFSKGDKNKVSTTPLTNTARALETVTKDTWAEPIGQLIGLAGKPEQWLREKQGLPEFGEYGDYYVDRQLANMVAEGLINSQQAQMAMIERNGELFDQARERVKMELAMRVPLMGTVYAATHEGLGAGAQSFLPSLFGSGLLPAGELEYRGLKDEWNAAWKMYDGGDKTAINNFFEEHPEYEAYLAKGKPPEERMRSFMIGNIWDAYMALGETNQKAARAQMGDDFANAFLNKETRSYESIDVQTLTQWAQMLGAMVPKTAVSSQQSAISQPQQQTLSLYPEQVTAITDKFFADRKTKYNDYYMLEQGYYSLPKSDRTAYLAKFPRLKEYWDWKDGYYEKYPELKPVFQGKVFKTVDTATWAPGLEQFVVMYAMTGQKLPKGAYSALEQVWIREGKPYDDMQVWLDAQVAPAMLYQTGQ